VTVEFHHLGDDRTEVVVTHDRSRLAMTPRRTALAGRKGWRNSTSPPPREKTMPEESNTITIARVLETG
jgi:hypothetical protein